jgi:hypothetical protein
MSSMRRSIGRAAILFAATAAAACGSDSGGDSTGGPDPVALSAARSAPSGDGQSGTAGQELASPLRIVVLRGSAPEAGAVVTWSTTGTGATLTPSTGTTGPDGISSSVWHLGAPGGGAERAGRGRRCRRLPGAIHRDRGRVRAADRLVLFRPAEVAQVSRIVAWSSDSRSVYYRERELDGRLTLLSIPLDGKAPTAVVRQRDASKSGARSDWATDGRRFFFTVPRYEGDVWTVEVR